MIGKRHHIVGVKRARPDRKHLRVAMAVMIDDAHPRVECAHRSTPVEIAARLVELGYGVEPGRDGFRVYHVLGNGAVRARIGVFGQKEHVELVVDWDGVTAFIREDLSHDGCTLHSQVRGEPSGIHIRVEVDVIVDFSPVGVAVIVPVTVHIRKIEIAGDARIHGTADTAVTAPDLGLRGRCRQRDPDSALVKVIVLDAVPELLLFVSSRVGRQQLGLRDYLRRDTLPRLPILQNLILIRMVIDTYDQVFGRYRRVQQAGVLGKVLIKIARVLDHVSDYLVPELPNIARLRRDSGFVFCVLKLDRNPYLLVEDDLALCGNVLDREYLDGCDLSSTDRAG